MSRPCGAATAGAPDLLHLFVRAPRPGGEARPRPPGESDGEGQRLVAVRVLDNDRNTYEEVMRIVMLALALELEEAFAVARTIDRTGSCVVARAPRREAEEIASVIRTIGIEVRLEELAAGAT